MSNRPSNASARGVPVLVEKPVAHSVEEGVRLAAAVDATNAKVLVGHHRAHSPILARAREVIQEGLLGKLVAVQGSAMFYKPDGYFDEAPWRREAGGGPILINLIHEIGNLRSLCGEIVAVQAVASHAARGFAVEDTVAINLCFANGALGNFLLSDTAACARSWEQTSQENKQYASHDDEDCYVIAGTRGSLSIPTMRLRTFGPDTAPSWFAPFDTQVVDLRRDDPLERQLGHFCAVIRGESAPLVTVHDGLQNLRVVDAIAAAARPLRPPISPAGTRCARLRSCPANRPAHPLPLSLSGSTRCGAVPFVPGRSSRVCGSGAPRAFSPDVITAPLRRVDQHAGPVAGGVQQRMAAGIAMVSGKTCPAFQGAAPMISEG
jgi:predicted dehydrogenase